MSGWSPREAIAMEKRHILEGEKRVARQAALAEELIEKGCGHLVPQCNELLWLLRKSLELSRECLRDLESRYGNAQGEK
jgi:hypothetical protein